MTQILETKDYEKFQPAEFNRDVKKTKELEKSMREHGFLSPYPLHVSMGTNGKLIIKAGNHRFFVARKLGIAVKYAISKDNATIHQLENSTIPHSMQDYLDAWVRTGKREYYDVHKYCEESGIPIGRAISLLGGHSPISANFNEMFKQGEYKIDRSSNLALKVKNILLYMKKCGISYACSSSCLIAVGKISLVAEFNEAQFMSRIKKYTFLFKKKANIEQYLELIETVYNHTSKTKIPLKFLSEEVARKRNAVKK